MNANPDHREKTRRQERLVRRLLAAASSISILTTLTILAILLVESFRFFSRVPVTEFLFGTQWTPLFTPKHFGVLPLVAGTFLTTGIACLVAIPVGLFTAVFLSQYARPSVRNVIKPFLEILSGIPTVVYGYFALVLVTPFLRKFFPQMNVFNALSAGLVMGIMIIPIVSSLSEDAMSAVPRHIREGALAMGATKLETTLKVIIPYSLSGIIASFILAISRAIGETMIVTLAAGATPKLTLNPFESIQTMTAYIVQVSLGDTPAGSIEYQTLFAVALLLFLITLVLNIIGKVIVNWNKEIF